MAKALMLRGRSPSGSQAPPLSEDGMAGSVPTEAWGSSGAVVGAPGLDRSGGMDAWVGGRICVGSAPGCNVERAACFERVFQFLMTRKPTSSTQTTPTTPMAVIAPAASQAGRMDFEGEVAA